MPLKQLAEDQRRFPVSLELCNLQAFCGDLYAGGHNEVNFESPWYMFFSCALPELLSTPPKSASKSGPPSSRTRFAVAPQYIFSLPRERAAMDSQTEDRIRKKFNRIPDFVVWFIDGAPQHSPPRTLANVTTKEHVLEYFKGSHSITKAAMLLCVEVKNLPDIHKARVVANLPDSLEEAEFARVAEAQSELKNKLVVHFSSYAEGEQVAVLACAGTRFAWNVAVRKGSDVLPTEIASSEDDSSYLPKPARTKPAVSGVTNAAEEAARNAPTGNPPPGPDSDSQLPRTRAAIKSAAAINASKQTNAVAQLPNEIRAATDRGKNNEAVILQKPSDHDDSQSTAGSSKDGHKGSGKETKPTRKKPSEMKVKFKGKWSSPLNWNDKDSASSKAKLWEAIKKANPGIEFWN